MDPRPDVENLKQVDDTGSLEASHTEPLELWNESATKPDQVQRKLSARHVQMIAVAGTIGTGVFLSSGQALALAGPLGLLIAFMLVGSVAYASLCSAAELACWAPVPGSFPWFATRFVDPALGFAMNFNYFYGSAMLVSTEITASAILITFWDADPSHTPIYLGVICALTCAINLFGARWFGESEVIFASIKVMLGIGLVLVGLILDLGGGPGHERTGFRYWSDPGPFMRAGLVDNINADRFLAFLSAIIIAAYSMQGMEFVAIVASETQSPRRNIRKAVKGVLFRVFLFFGLWILVLGMVVNPEDPLLLKSSGTAAQSPFVIAINRAGIRGLPSIVNAGILTSAFSAGNTLFFVASRILHGAAVRGHAPRVLSRCTKDGTPIAAILVVCLFPWLSFMAVSEGAATVFGWFVNIVSVAGFISWLCINLTYIRFDQGRRAQGIARSPEIFTSRFQPYLAYYALFWTIVLILISGLTVFWRFTASKFVAAYVNIPIFAGLFLFWKVLKRTSFMTVHEMDFVTDVPTLEETETPEVVPQSTLGRVFQAVF